MKAGSSAKSSIRVLIPRRSAAGAAGTLDPTFDNLVVADGGSEAADGIQAIGHGGGGRRVGRLEGGEVGLGGQTGGGLINGVGLVVEIADGSAAVASLAGFGDGGDVIEVEALNGA